MKAPAKHATDPSIEQVSKHPDADHTNHANLGRLQQLEGLVDELIKMSPQENRIRSYMKAVGLPYSDDPMERMDSVLTALDDASLRTVDQ